MELHQDPAVVTAEELKDALLAADQLAERPFAVVITSIERGYLPRAELKNLPAGIHITVMPGLDGDSEVLHRSAKRVTFHIGVAVESKVAPEDMSNTTLDALAGLMESIETFFEDVELPSGAEYQRAAKVSPRYSFRHLKLANTWVGLRKFEFKIGLKAGT